MNPAPTPILNPGESAGEVSHSLTVKPASCTRRRTTPSHEASQPATSTDPRLSEAEPHEQWLREQYLRELDTLDRCERCIEEQAGCPDFFGCMGQISRARSTA